MTEVHANGQVDIDDPNGFFLPVGDRSIKDIIHDEIPIYNYLSRFIDTEPFQRLRDIKQLGTSSYVWPNATHTRFEHCLGVSFLARSLVSQFKANQPELGLTNRDVACVEIAGLCHDLGHGPWSHVWDGIFMPAADPHGDWKHEMGSEMMFDYMVDTYKIPISEKDRLFIKALIAGEPADCDPSEKIYLFEVVANKRNGLDVDKFDYIQRDSRMTQEDFSFPVMRILRSARVVKDQICYRIKDVEQIYRIFHSRLSLHKHVYNHKTARAIEYMIVDALLSADPIMNISQRVYDPEQFLHLNDFIMNEIEMSRDPALEFSRKLLKRIRTRDLYRCVDRMNLDWSTGKAVSAFVTRNRIFEKIQSIISRQTSASPGSASIDDNTSDLTAEDIIVDLTTMHHGMKEHNPVDFVTFYGKGDNANVPVKVGPGDYSELRPALHAEMLLRIYSKKSDVRYCRLIQEAFRAVLSDFDEVAESNEEEEHATRAVALQAPSTPSAVQVTPPAASPRAAVANMPVPATPGSVGISRGSPAPTKRKLTKVASHGASHGSFWASPIGSRRTSPATTDLSSNIADRALCQKPSDEPQPAFESSSGMDLSRRPLNDLFDLEQTGDPNPSADTASTGTKRGRENENDALLSAHAIEGCPAPKRKKEGGGK